MMELIKYDAACLAIAEAKSIDDVKEITNRAAAARAYARQAKNRQLELDALEIRVRAERRLGEIIIELKSSNTVGQGRGGHPIHLERDLDIDHGISAGAQRLAKMSAERFQSEMGDWREDSEVSSRIQVPLQRYRKPSITAQHQRQAARRGSKTINIGCPLDKFRTPDGRRMSDWRVGELVRLKQIYARVGRCVDKIIASMPIANPDPLDTIEMVFRDSKVLAGLLEEEWNSEKIHQGNAGNQQ